MGQLKELELVQGLWDRANPNMREFLKYSRVCPNDRQACEAVGIDPACPIQWRKRHDWFVQLEEEFRRQPYRTALLFLVELYPKAVASLNQVLSDPKATNNERNVASRAVMKHITEVNDIILKQKAQRIDLRFKNDDGRGDRPALQPALGSEACSRLPEEV